MCVSEVNWPIGRNQTKELFLFMAGKMVRTVSIRGAKLSKYWIIIKLALYNDGPFFEHHFGRDYGYKVDMADGKASQNPLKILLTDDHRW